MKLTGKQESFILHNRGALRELFEGRIEDLKEELIMCPDEKRGVIIELIREQKVWMKNIKILETQKEREMEGNPVVPKHV